jgi:DNA (cytosine-5)-methyltransferase 1
LTITGAATREFVHPSEDRLLTLRECARLQTFPDRFQFSGNAASRIRQIGNAIPPLLAYTLAEHITEGYGFEPQPSRKTQTVFRFRLTRSDGMSPALVHTEVLLSELAGNDVRQMLLFDSK